MGGSIDERMDMCMPWHTHGGQRINLGAGPPFAGSPDACTRLVDLQASRATPVSAFSLCRGTGITDFHICVDSGTSN